MAYEYARQDYLADESCILMKPKTSIDENGIRKVDGYEEVEVLCHVSSIYMREVYKAYEAGIKPYWRVIVFADDYDDEVTVKFRDEIYNVYRLFYSGDTVELYLRKDDGAWLNGESS